MNGRSEETLRLLPPGNHVSMTVYDQLDGERGLKKVASKSIPLRYRLLHKAGFGTEFLRNMLLRCYSIEDVIDTYHSRRWTKLEFDLRPRLHKLVPALKTQGVAESSGSAQHPSTR